LSLLKLLAVSHLPFSLIFFFRPFSWKQKRSCCVKKRRGGNYIQQYKFILYKLHTPSSNVCVCTGITYRERRKDADQYYPRVDPHIFSSCIKQGKYI
jgi:hypothetical protein